MKIDICKIKVTARIRKQTVKIDELAADIKKNGLLNPVTVMPSGEEYQLLAGLRRLRAAQSLGWTEIEVNAVTPKDAESALNIEYSENIQREQFTFSEKMDYTRLIEEIEQAKAKERMLAGKKNEQCDPMHHGAYPPQGTRRSIIGGKIGMSGFQYDRAKYIADRAPQDVIDALDSGERSISKTYAELRTKAQAEESEAKPRQPIHPPAVKTRQHRPNLSAHDEEAVRKLHEYHALPPEGKIAELQRQLREERARAAGAESELARLQELHHNDVYHRDSIIESLNRQLGAANARILELEAKYESV